MPSLALIRIRYVYRNMQENLKLLEQTWDNARIWNIRNSTREIKQANRTIHTHIQSKQLHSKFFEDRKVPTASMLWKMKIKLDISLTWKPKNEKCG